MDGLFKGKNVLIAGGNRDVGALAAKTFLRQGASLVALIYQKNRSRTFLTIADFKKIAAENPQHPTNYFAIEGDILTKRDRLFHKLDQETRFEKKCLIEEGQWTGGDQDLKFDYFINAAGVTYMTNPLPANATLDERIGHLPNYAPVSPAEFAAAMASFIHEVAERMRPGGRIIALTNGHPNYAKTLPKQWREETHRAAEDLFRRMAPELAPRGISINSISCGPYEATHGAWLQGPGNNYLAAPAAMSCLGSKEGVAAAIIELAATPEPFTGHHLFSKTLHKQAQPA